ncbi:hypothetical protein SLS58_009139 [Diplodia intermedia]|uniref:Uncharacterized protein n=1 Tax=Diplodia intermedia TaxID=856260 RepID=A0ABR3TEA9_9PEZI
MAMDLRFTYAITRPYPFRYFTIIVAVVFVVMTIVFSLFNTVVAGYDLRVSYSTNPNITTEQKLWYDNPFFAGIKKLSPSCEPKEIGIKQSFNTDKNGLIYTLNKVKNVGAPDSPTLPSLLYLNNHLQDCEVSYIKIEMEKESRTGQQVAWSRWGPSVFGAISCSVMNELGHMRIDITAEYDLVPANAAKLSLKLNETSWDDAARQNLFQFITSNNTEVPAMWWAESIMSYSWVAASLDMSTYNKDLETGFQKGTFNYWPSGNVSDFSDLSFFEISWYFLLETGGVYARDDDYDIEADITSAQNWIKSADALAKAFYSTVLADLGTADGPNLLTDEAALRTFTSNFSDAPVEWVPAGPATGSYGSPQLVMGKPVINNSTIFNNYLCQTPVQKVPASLIVSVLLADLVFLRTLWSVMNLASTYIAEKKDAKGTAQLTRVLLRTAHKKWGPWSKSGHDYRITGEVK